MEFLIWHGLAITTIIAVSFGLGFITGKTSNNATNNKQIYRNK